MRSIDESIHGPKIEHAQSLGPLESPPESVPSDDLGQIQQGSGDGGNRDAFHRSPIVRVQVANQVDGDAGPATVIAPRGRYVNRSTIARPDPPQRRGALVTENGVGAAGEYRRRQPAEYRDVRVADGVHASVQAMQPPRAQTVLDAGPAEPQLDELPVRHDTMLPICDLSNLAVTWSSLWAHIAQILDHVAQVADDHVPCGARSHAITRRTARP